LCGKKDIPGKHYPVPDDASANGCKRPESLRVPIGADWPSGYYEMTMKAEDRGGAWIRRGSRTVQNTLFFVVRPAKPSAKILLQLCMNTSNAYTNYAGFSLYAYHAGEESGPSRVV